MRLVIMSDSHMGHRSLRVPDGDVLIHCGDFTNMGSLREMEDFAAWLTKQPHNSKIVVPGNHDLCFDGGHRGNPRARELIDAAGAELLVDAGVTVGGVRFWGSPRTPQFGDWAFMYDRAQHPWTTLPNNIDVLVTHGPPHGILDQCPDSQGCFGLLQAVKQRKPRVHAFGHIHEKSGLSVKQDGTTFINAAQAVVVVEVV